MEMMNANPLATATTTVTKTLDDGDTFVLASRAHNTDMMIGLNNLRLEGYFVDVVLCVQDTEYPCHRNILATSSPYFRAMFCSDLREAHDFRVSFNDISPDTMNRILNYVYLGSITINRDNVEDILAAASLFQFAEIETASCEFLKEQLDVSNCLGIEAFAALHGCVTLQNFASKVIQENFKDVAFQEEFLSLGLDQVVSYISSDQIDIDSEKDVFDVVLRWVKHRLEERKSFLPVLMGHVRFQTMEISALKTVLEDRLVRSSPECYGIVVEAFEFLTRRGGRSLMRQSPPSRPVEVRPNAAVVAASAVVSVDASSSPPESSTSSSALDFSSSSSSSCPGVGGASVAAGACNSGGGDGSDAVNSMMLDSSPMEEDDEDAKQRIIEAIAKIVEENSLKNDGGVVADDGAGAPPSSAWRSSVIPSNQISSTQSSSNRPQDEQEKSGDGSSVVRPHLKLQSPRPSTIAKECLILLGGNRFTKSEQEAMNVATNQGSLSSSNSSSQLASTASFPPPPHNHHHHHHHHHHQPTTPPLSPPTTPTTPLIMYCPLRDKWISLPDLPCKLKYYSMAVLNNDIYISGGIQQHFVDPFPAPASAPSTLQSGGNNGAGGGNNPAATSQTLVSTVWRFVTRTREWILLPAPMSRPRAKHASCGFKSKLFVFGGISPIESRHASADAQASGRRTNLLNEAIECYDFATGCWSVVCTTPFPRKHSVVVPFKDKIFEIGGTTYETRGSGDVNGGGGGRGAGGGRGGADPILGPPRSHHHGRGHNSSSNNIATTSSLSRSNMIESFAYSPSDGKLVYSGEHFVLPSHVHFAQVIVLDEVFYIISEDSRTCLAFTPQKRSIRKLAHLQHSHFNSGATGLGGKIYVVGGLVNGFVSNVVETYDPEKDTWEIGKALPFCLSGHGCVSVLM